MKTILILGNNFTGAYGSLNCFVQEIVWSLKKMNHRVLLANSVSEAVKLYDNNDIDFSIGIGKYSYFKEGKPLYDSYKLLHYQWLIDNPLKLEIDSESNYIKYILIDKLFSCCMNQTQKPFLYLPLGIPKFNNTTDVEKEYGIVFSGQIRDSNAIFEEIDISKRKREIKNLLDILISDLDLLYILELKKSVEKLPSCDRTGVFSLTNSFLRAYKREKVLNEIRDIPVSIIGENKSKILLKNKNITLLGKVPYYESFEIMSKYMFNLNIEPNFNCGFHDRILRGAAKGSVVITNYGKIQREILGSDAIYYSFANLDMISDQILNLQKTEIVEMGDRLIETVSYYFTWEKILECILCDFGGVYENENNRLFRILGN